MVSNTKLLGTVTRSNTVSSVACSTLIDEGGPYQQGLPEDVAICVLKSVLKALDYLHQNHVVHRQGSLCYMARAEYVTNDCFRDIRARNVLLSSDGHVVLANLGSAGHISCDGRRRKLVGLAGKPAWMAPEVCAQVGPLQP